MADRSEIAARITLHPIQAAIRIHTTKKDAFYTISFGHYFKSDDQGEGWEPLEDISERNLPMLAKVVELAQAEIVKLRAADRVSENPADAT